MCTQKLVKARAALLLLPTHVVRQAIPRRLVPHPNGRCHMPAPRPAAKDVHKTSELSFQPLQSHSSQAKLCHAPAMPNQAILTHPTHKPRKKFYTCTHTICHQPSQTAEQPRQACHCCARAVLAHPTSHATAVLELRPRVPMFLPLCERPCSSASRCPQGSMEPYAWPNTQQYQSSPSDGQPLQSHTSRAKLHKPCSRNRCQGQCCCCCCRQGRRHRRRPLLPKHSKAACIMAVKPSIRK